MVELLLLLLPVAAASGWMAAKQHYHDKKNDPIPQDYFKGLNFLLNEQPDKAVEVFIKVLEVNSDTVETHLALGNLFRKQGEVDRAIRIHQNLIARPHLAKAQRNQALFALAKDYLSAGVLDRSERLFLDALEENNRDLDSLNHLLDIYQQEKSWEQAIETAQKLQSLTGKSRQTAIAHYYCELTQQALNAGEIGQARLYLKRAFATDKQAARASLLKAKMEASLERYPQAIQALEHLKENNPDYFSEAIPALVSYHKQLNSEKVLCDYLEKSLETCPRTSSALVITEHLHEQDPQQAIHFLTQYLRKNCSLRGLVALLDLQQNCSSESEKDRIQQVQTSIKHLLAQAPTYLCHQCGFNGKTLLWICPSCKQWNSIKPIIGLEGE